MFKAVYIIKVGGRNMVHEIWYMIEDIYALNNHKNNFNKLSFIHMDEPEPELGLTQLTVMAF